MTVSTGNFGLVNPAPMHGWSIDQLAYLPVLVDPSGALILSDGSAPTGGNAVSHASSSGTPIAATTTGVIAAPSAAHHLSIKRFLLSNGGATATWVALRDGAAGTKHYVTYLPQNGVVSLNLRASGALNLTTATRLDIYLSAAGSVEYEIDYETDND